MELNVGIVKDTAENTGQYYKYTCHAPLTKQCFGDTINESFVPNKKSCRARHSLL